MISGVSIAQAMTNSCVAAFLVTMPIVTCAGAQTLKAHAIADVVGFGGKKIGTVDFSQTGHGVLIEIELSGLPPGAHGVHIHGSGVCEARKHFASAGPHLSLVPHAHGYLAKGGPHEGDLPNQFAAGDGALHASTITNAFTIGNGERSIFDRDGAAIIVDSKADDYVSQPAGNSGDRIACGVIVRTVAPGTRRGASHNTHA